MAKKAKPPTPQVSRRHMVPPTNVIRLMDTVGGTRTSGLLGVSTTLLYKAKKEGAINQVVELAASGALESLGKSDRHSQHSFSQARGGEVAYLVTISRDKAETFERMAKMLNAELVSA